MSEEKKQVTVGQYLALRLKQLGVSHIFGVPGDNLAPFLEIIEKEHLGWIGGANEMVSGYAADGFARINGIGAVGVTYSVGALSLINAVAGSFIEMVPVIVINAAPSNEAHLNYDAVGFLTSHMSPKRESNLAAFRQVTVAAEVISNSRLAPKQIDTALSVCVSEMRPVYLEVYADVWTAPCEMPEEELSATPRPSSPKGLKNCAEAVEALTNIIKSSGENQPIFWCGVEIDRYQLQENVKRLIEETGINFSTSIMGKSILSEAHKQFVGIYNGNATDPAVKEIFEKATCRIGLGAWTTSKDLEGVKVWEKNIVLAAHNGVKVNQRYFPDVRLEDFIKMLTSELIKLKKEATLDPFDFFGEFSKKSGIEACESGTESAKEAFFAQYLESSGGGDTKLTYDSFFKRINEFLKKAEFEADGTISSPYTIISDAGFALIGSQILRIVEPGNYFSQTSYLSIGYSVGAATGLKVARPEKRVLVFVGDGSFQETVQALSTQANLRHNTIIFIFNNGNFYGIEQMLVDPCYYAEKAEPHFYNFLHPWNYEKLADVFGGANDENGDKYVMTGRVVKTHDELDKLLEEIRDSENPINSGPMVVRVIVPINDFPRAIEYKTKNCDL